MGLFLCKYFGFVFLGDLKQISNRTKMIVGTHEITHHFKCLKIVSRFKDEKAAELAVHRLHQLDILGHKLSAEIARGKAADSFTPVDVRYVIKQLTKGRGGVFIFIILLKKLLKNLRNKMSTK